MHRQNERKKIEPSAICINLTKYCMNIQNNIDYITIYNKYNNNHHYITEGLSGYHLR